MKQTIQKEEQFRKYISKLQELNEQLKQRIKNGSEEDDSSVSIPDFPDDHFSFKSNSTSSVSSAAVSSVGLGYPINTAMSPVPTISSSSATPVVATSVAPMGLPLQQPNQQQWDMVYYGNDPTLFQHTHLVSPCEEPSDDEERSINAEDHCMLHYLTLISKLFLISISADQFHPMFAVPSNYPSMTKRK